MLHAHLLQKLAQAHVGQHVAAAILKALADLALCDLPAGQTEYFIGRKIVDRPEELKFISEIVDILHETQAFRQPVIYTVKEALILLPRPADAHEAVNTGLPMPHKGLLDLRQVGAFDIERGDDICILLHIMLRPAGIVPARPYILEDVIREGISCIGS